DAALAAFAGQELAWAPCEEVAEDQPPLECAGLRVPVDWAAPQGAPVEVALARLRATGTDRVGALVVDPGGPGASGVGWLRAAGAGVVTEAVAARYDVVAFDPRGAGASAPLRCLDDAGMDAFLAGGEGSAGLLARGCAERGGPLVGHVDVASVARDVEVLRSALGEERLHYLGKSWGTLLGATYAGLHPQRVGRMVLDGALDPASDAADVLLGQAEGLEGALGAYLADCAERGSCPLDDDPAAGGDQVRDLLEAAEADPLPTGTDRELTAPLALLGVIAPLYDDDTWPLLDEALAAALDDDGSVLIQLADAYADRREDGTYATNLLQAFTATTCLDQPEVGPAEAEAARARLLEVAPVLGEALAGDGGSGPCEGWPVPPVRTPAPIAAEGAAPILVLGTTGDPATPYAWAQALADQLTSGRLLTREGEGHTAYRQGSACVDAAVDAYLLDGVLPGEGATCRS
ncbi:MAG: Probable exported protease, partial [uncultured Quadrisphaera sp.]